MNQSVNVDARAKCWRTATPGELVPDGDERAVALFARKGQSLPRKSVEVFDNAKDFFFGFDSAPAEPEEPKASKKKNARE